MRQRSFLLSESAPPFPSGEVASVRIWPKVRVHRSCLVSDPVSEDCAAGIVFKVDPPKGKRQFDRQNPLKTELTFNIDSRRRDVPGPVPLGEGKVLATLSRFPGRQQNLLARAPRDDRGIFAENGEARIGPSPEELDLLSQTREVFNTGESVDGEVSPALDILLLISVL